MKKSFLFTVVLALLLVSVGLVSALSGEGLDKAVDLITGCRSAATDLPERRRAQAAGWVAARLLESLGSIGFAALAPLRPDLDRPFEWVRSLESRAREAVHQGLKNI